MMNPETDTPSPKRGSWYQRLFASALAAEGQARQEDYDERKRTLIGDLHGDVLEIGPGAGVNLGYYSGDVRWTGLEPNPAMFPYIEQEAQRLGMSIQLHEGRAEHIDATDNHFDAVVGTLVLCSVRDPGRTMAEILRVLKPGGRFVFIEHVAAPRDSNQRRFQRFIKPLWRTVIDGCHPDRETWVTIENAGFSHVQIEHFRLDLPIVGTQIAGYAIK